MSNRSSGHAAAAVRPDWAWLRARPLLPRVRSLLTARTRPRAPLTQLEMTQWLVLQGLRGRTTAFEPSHPSELLRGETLDRSPSDRFCATDAVLRWWANRSLPQAFPQVREKLALADHSEHRNNERAAQVLELIGWSACFARTHRLQATELSRQVAASAGSGAADLLYQADACRKHLLAGVWPDPLPDRSA